LKCGCPLAKSMGVLAVETVAVSVLGGRPVGWFGRNLGALYPNFLFFSASK